MQLTILVVSFSPSGGIMAEVVLQKVCKRYGEVSAIEDLDLEIRGREFMVLVGPSRTHDRTVVCAGVTKRAVGLSLKPAFSNAA